ncbi:MAG: hypothetical protein LBQ86_08915 [Holophagales bacterium]|jgi:hypothetical protein|nr:hypothetical protein [Holophagales bacterium]
MKNQPNEIEKPKPSASFYGDVKAIILDAKAGAVRSVDFQRVLMYWRLAKGFSLRNSKAKTVRNTANI